MMSNSRYINLGCGPVFVDSPEWANLDYSPSSPSVTRANLLAPLPLKSGSVELVYSSHFLEHIPKPDVQSFLGECHRVLQPGGVLRLVLPDLEEMARSYLDYRDSAQHERADFLVLELIDQCVRRTSGGELGSCYQSLRSQPISEVKEMTEFVRERTGEALHVRARPSHKSGSDGAGEWSSQLPARIRNRLQLLWVRFWAYGFPAAFRAQNISMSDVGERHHWLWDFHQLQQALETVGFAMVERRSAGTSAIRDFPFQQLDLDTEGRPRKGAESMFVEAIKPE